MAQPSPTEEMEMDKLVRKMKIVERTINELLSVKQPAGVGCASLEAKLFQMEQLISDIPKDLSLEYELEFNEWNDKLAFWWKRYSMLMDSSSHCNSESDGPNASFEDDNLDEDLNRFLLQFPTAANLFLSSDEDDDSENDNEEVEEDSNDSNDEKVCSLSFSEDEALEEVKIEKLEETGIISLITTITSPKKVIELPKQLSVGQQQQRTFDAPPMPLAKPPGWQTRKPVERVRFRNEPPRTFQVYQYRQYLPLNFIPTAKRRAILEDQQAKCQIRDQMAALFGSLESFVESKMNVEVLKELISAVAQARHVSMPFWADKRFHAELFMLAFKKLSHKQQEHFCAVYDRQLRIRSLQLLMRFLCGQIRFFYGNLNRSNATQHQELKETFSYYASYISNGGDDNCGQDEEEENKFKTIVLCGYCKTVGHATCDCPTLKNMVCFKCFQSGHKAKKCTVAVI